MEKHGAIDAVGSSARLADLSCSPFRGIATGPVGSVAREGRYRGYHRPICPQVRPEQQPERVQQRFPLMVKIGAETRDLSSSSSVSIGLCVTEKGRGVEHLSRGRTESDYT